MWNEGHLLTADPGLELDATESQGPIEEGGKYIFAFFWLFTLAVFGRPEDIFPALAVFHFPLVFATCGLMAYLFALCLGRARFVWSTELVVILILTFWFTLGIPFAFWRSGSLEVLTEQWCRTVIGFFLLTQTLTSIGRVRKLVWAIVLSEMVATVASLAL